MKFIIDFKNNLTEQEINDYLTGINGSVVQTFQFTERTYLIECPQEPIFDSNIHEHIINDDDHHIQLLNSTIVFDQQWGTSHLTGPTVTISTTDNKDWWKNYVVKKPKFDEVSYTIDRKGTGYVVYVMDSGCKISHPEFAGRPVQNLFTFNGDYTDKAGHGTTLASVITGNVCGVSDATVKVVRIFDPDQPTKQSDMINALDAIYQDFIANTYDNAVINCSWTISKNAFIESKFQILHEMGLVIVAAAGNSGVPIENVTPASMNCALTIGSFNSDLEPSDFSNYTESATSLTQNSTNHGELDGWAPGENIYAAYPINDSYSFVAGTSIAAAIQSAVVVYNLETYSLSSPRKIPHNQFVSQSSLSRFNILDLSNPKYSNSRNAIATMHTEVADVSNNTYTTVAMAVSNTNFATRICDPRAYKRLEILGTLPVGLTVDNTALFGGMAQTVSEINVIDVNMRLVDNNDQEFPFVFKIVTTPNGWEEGDSTNDPTLDLMLQGGCFQRDCSTPGCFNNCGAFLCSQYPDKGCAYGVGARCECYF